MFVLYEEDYAEDEEEDYSTGPDDEYYGNVDGLSSAGGRL